MDGQQPNSLAALNPQLLAQQLRKKVGGAMSPREMSSVNKQDPNLMLNQIQGMAGSAISPNELQALYQRLSIQNP